jgi:hypothetical protein
MRRTSMYEHQSKRVRRAVALTALVATTLAVGPAAVAKADPGSWNYYPACRNYTANIFNSAASYTYESANHTVQATSSCSDINSIAHACQNHRIRFYPSGGGSFVNSWTFDCDGAHVVASSVQNTTVYRNEGGAFGYFHIED